MAKTDAMRVLVVDPRDNVATSLATLSAGDSVAVDVGGQPHALALTSDIPFGHKFAITAIAAGGEVRKYGVVIAQAKRPIGTGEHVHVHNVESRRGRGDLA